MGSVLPREKSGVDSVPWRMLTASRGVLKVLGWADGVGTVTAAAAAEAGDSATRVEAMAAMLEVLRNVLRDVFFSFWESAKLHLFVGVAVGAISTRMKAYRMEGVGPAG